MRNCELQSEKKVSQLATLLFIKMELILFDFFLIFLALSRSELRRIESLTFFVSTVKNEKKEQKFHFEFGSIYFNWTTDWITWQKLTTHGTQPNRRREKYRRSARQQQKKKKEIGAKKKRVNIIQTCSRIERCEKVSLDVIAGEQELNITSRVHIDAMTNDPTDSVINHTLDSIHSFRCLQNALTRIAAQKVTAMKCRKKKKKQNSFADACNQLQEYLRFTERARETTHRNIICQVAVINYVNQNLFNFIV